MAKILVELKIPFRYLEHEAVFSVAESVAHVNKNFPVKNLMLKEQKGDSCVLVVMKGDERLDTKKLASELAVKKLHFAKPDILLAKLGVSPGSVSLFSILSESVQGVELVIDERLFDQKELGFHPNDNTKTYFIDGEFIELLMEAYDITFHRMSL